MIVFVFVAFIHFSSTAINSLNGRIGRLVRSMAHLFDVQYHHGQQQQQQLNECLFDSGAFIETLDLILKYDRHYFDAVDAAILNIIGKLTEWIIRNNLPNDGTFLMSAWNALNFNGYDGDLLTTTSALKFNRTELIRLLAHSIFGYPHAIDGHEIGCTCKRRPIDWNGLSLLFTSLHIIING